MLHFNGKRQTTNVLFKMYSDLLTDMPKCTSLHFDRNQCTIDNLIFICLGTESLVSVVGGHVNRKLATENCVRSRIGHRTFRRQQILIVPP